MNYIKTFNENSKEYYDKLSDHLDRINSFGKFVNRSRMDDTKGISQNFKDYLYDFIDDEWSYYLDKSNFYRKIILKKKILNFKDPELIFDDVLKMCRSVESYLKQEDMNVHFVIIFNRIHQQEFNPGTIRNDKYSYKGIGNKEDIDAEVQFIII